MCLRLNQEHTPDTKKPNYVKRAQGNRRSLCTGDVESKGRAVAGEVVETDLWQNYGALLSRMYFNLEFAQLVPRCFFTGDCEKISSSSSSKHCH